MIRKEWTLLGENNTIQSLNVLTYEIALKKLLYERLSWKDVCNNLELSRFYLLGVHACLIMDL